MEGNEVSKGRRRTLAWRIHILRSRIPINLRGWSGLEEKPVGFNLKLEEDINDFLM